MNLEIPIPPNPERDNKKKKPNEKGLSRRMFLRNLGIGTAALAVGAIELEELLKEKESNQESIKDTPEPEENTKEQNTESIGIEDNDVIGQTFREQLEKGPHITLDKATRQAIYDNWYHRYSPGTVEYQAGIVEGLERMYPWIEDIKQVFAAQNVPEEFVYLAIAESNFRTHDVSEKKATGPYQIIENLKGLETQLIINADRDERLDPVRSAEFCANHLHYGYGKFRGNWDLALLDYNGGFTKDFLKYLPRKEQRLPKEEIIARGIYTIKAGDTYSEIAEKFETSESLLWKLNCDTQETYEEWHNNVAPLGKELVIPQKREVKEEDFYQWMEGEINKKIDEELSCSFYTIKEGDTLKTLARALQLELIDLKSFNPDVDEKTLELGQKINTPKIYKKNVDYLLFILSNFKENINYPGKFHAILKIIEENRLKPQPGEFQMRYDKTTFKHATTLADIAKLENISVENLKVANPSILNSQATLEEKTEIRLPRHIHIKERHKHKREVT